jgi:hypothetical protein
VQIHHLNAIPPRIAKIATKRRFEFQPILAGYLFAHLRDLLLVAHHQTAVPHAIRLKVIHFENRED